MNVVVRDNHELVAIPTVGNNGVWQIKCETCDVQFHSMQELENHLNGSTKNNDSFDRAMKGVI